MLLLRSLETIALLKAAKHSSDLYQPLKPFNFKVCNGGGLWQPHDIGANSSGMTV